MVPEMLTVARRAMSRKRNVGYVLLLEGSLEGQVTLGSQALTVQAIQGLTRLHLQPDALVESNPVVLDYWMRFSFREGPFW